MNFSQLLSLAETVLEETIAELPDEIRSLAREVPVLLEKRAEPLEAGIEPDEVLLGLFEGPDHSEETQISGYHPRISLYLLTLWDFCQRDEDHFRQEVADTYLHELGHYLGWDEEEIARRGLG